MFKFAIPLLASLALVACSNPAPTPAPESSGGPVPVATATPVESVIDEQALYAAEALYNVPAHAYVTADFNGTLPANVKASVKPVLVKAYDALKLARTAYAVGNAANFYAAVAELGTLSAQATALLPSSQT